MTSETKILQQLEQMDDAALEEMIRTVATAMGLGSFKTKLLTSNPARVRKKLEETDPAKFAELLSGLDEATLAALLAKCNANR